MAARLIARLLPLAEAVGANRELVSLLLLQARAAWNQGVTAEAEQALARALQLAAPEGLLAPFVSAGRELLPLLKGTTGATTPTFTAQILAILGELETIPGEPEKAGGPVELVEPLSEREAEVLQLLGAGRSNREIGLALSISLATVKWHASNIYGKLGVGNRTEAVVRAQQLGLLP
jgi:LuxR family maltose regulon positive regulatory protein